MEDTGFAIYSQLEEGFLVDKSPSLWTWDVQAAIRFPSEAEARAAAARRGSALAVPARLYKVNGKLNWELIPLKKSPAGGGWIIKMEDIKTGITWYLVKGGKKLLVTNTQARAKGYKSETTAKKAEAQINASTGFRAERIQVTGQILPFTRTK